MNINNFYLSINKEKYSLKKKNDKLVLTKASNVKQNSCICNHDSIALFNFLKDKIDLNFIFENEETITVPNGCEIISSKIVIESLKKILKNEYYPMFNNKYLEKQKYFDFTLCVNVANKLLEKQISEDVFIKWCKDYSYVLKFTYSKISKRFIRINNYISSFFNSIDKGISNKIPFFINKMKLFNQILDAEIKGKRVLPIKTNKHYYVFIKDIDVFDDPINSFCEIIIFNNKTKEINHLFEQNFNYDYYDQITYNNYFDIPTYDLKRNDLDLDRARYNPKLTLKSII